MSAIEKEIGDKNKAIQKTAAHVSELEKGHKDATQAKGKMVADIVDAYKEIRAKAPARVTNPINGKTVDLQTDVNIKLPGVNAKVSLGVPSLGDRYDVFQGLTQGESLKKALPNMQICGLTGDKDALVVKDNKGAVHILGQDGKMHNAFAAHKSGDAKAPVQAYFSTAEEAKKYEDTSKANSDKGKAENETSKKESQATLEKPGVRTETFAGRTFITDVVDASGKRSWHQEYAFRTADDTAGDAISVRKVVFTERNDAGGYITRTFLPNPNHKGEWLCNTETMESKGADIKRTGINQDCRYFLNPSENGKTGLSFTKLDREGRATADSQSYNEDGTRSITRMVTQNNYQYKVTESFPSQPIPGIQGGDVLPTKVDYPNSSTWKYTLTHKSNDGRPTPIGLYTKDDDKSTSKKTYIWKNGEMKEYVEYADPLPLENK